MKKLLLAALFCATSASAQTWVSENPAIHFLSIKVTQSKNSITEQSNFKQAYAELQADGQFKLEIDLNSVHTNIPLRDERLRDWVFKTAEFPKAIATGKVDMAAVNALKVGQNLELKQDFVLEIHGEKLNLQAHLAVQRAAENQLRVSSLNPIVLDVKQMKMTAGVAQMVEVMGLSSIVEQVPVSIAFDLQQKM